MGLKLVEVGGNSPESSGRLENDLGFLQNTSTGFFLQNRLQQGTFARCTLNIVHMCPHPTTTQENAAEAWYIAEFDFL